MASRRGNQFVTDADREALAMYAVASRDVTDFIDMLDETTDGALQTLHNMMGHDNPTQSTEDRELNALCLPFVAHEIAKRAEL